MKNIRLILLLTLLTVSLSVAIAFEKRINTYLTNTFAEKVFINDHISNVNSKQSNEFEISFDFIAPDGNISLQNLFQTADINSGIRAEFSEKRELFIIASDESGKLLGIKAANYIESGKTYSLSVVYNNSNLQIKLNGQLIPNNFHTLAIKYDHLLMYEGFSHERKFMGNIFNIQGYYLIKSDRNYSLYIIGLNLLFIFISLMFIFNSKYACQVNSTKAPIYNSAKYNALLSIRTLAWVFVFIIHSYIIFNVNISEHKILLLDNDITFLIFPSAWAGVWIFFVLSGFLMGKGFYSLRYKLDNEGIKNFFINRAIQIFPLYFFSIILIAIFVHPEILKLSNIEYLLRLLTFTNDSELPININGALWTISTEVQFYLTVPFLMYLLMLLFKNGIDIKKVVFILLLLLVFGIVIRSSIYHIYDHDFSIWSKYIYKPFFANFDLFLFGMAANFIIPLVSNSIKNYIYNKSALLVLIMLIFFNSYMGYQTFVLNHFSYFFVAAMPSITALLTIYLIVYIETIGIQKAIEKKIEKKKLIHYIGLLTFPIYIWHEPVLLQINKITDSKVYLLNVTVAIVMILIIAVASYFWIENAMNKSKKTD